MVKILLILLAIAAALFVLTLLVYFLNLDMKLAAAMIPLMNRIYDRGDAKRQRAEDKKKKEKTDNARKKNEM